GEGSHQLARPFGQGDWSCPAPSPQPSPARGEGARSPFVQGRYCYFNGIGGKPQDVPKRPLLLPVPSPNRGDRRAPSTTSSSPTAPGITNWTFRPSKKCARASRRSPAPWPRTSLPNVRTDSECYDSSSTRVLSSSTSPRTPAFPAQGKSPSRTGFGTKFPQRGDYPINSHHRFLAGKVLADVSCCPVIPGGAIGEQGYQCGQGGGLFLGCGGNHGSGKKAGGDGFQDVMELLRIRAGDHGELANGGKLEVEGDQALAGGGRGVFEDDLDRIESCPPGAAEVVTTGQGAQPDQGGRGHCVA